jgi:hypothetical protein
MTDASAKDADFGLEAIIAMDRSALVARWAVAFGSPAPRNCQVTLLRGALAWHFQLTHSVKSSAIEIESIIRRLQRSLASSAPCKELAPGTRLLREWQGQTHHVTVTARGFEYSGTTYRSLTAIARHITGTAWSGPLFFGLRS